MDKQWGKGRDTLNYLLREKDIEKVMELNDSDVKRLFQESEKQIKYCKRYLNEDQDYAEALVSAYRAVKKSGEALLAKQGLRATAQGGHIAIEDLLREQIGKEMTFHGLRQTRHNIEYPPPGGAKTSKEDAEEGLRIAQDYYGRAKKIAPMLPWHISSAD